jgi:hypothetical protein
MLTVVHDVIPADRAVVDYNVPCPQSYRIPLQQARSKDESESTISQRQ